VGVAGGEKENEQARQQGRAAAAVARREKTMPHALRPAVSKTTLCRGISRARSPRFARSSEWPAKASARLHPLFERTSSKAARGVIVAARGVIVRAICELRSHFGCVKGENVLKRAYVDVCRVGQEGLVQVVMCLRDGTLARKNPFSSKSSIGIYISYNGT
jgi:hypothetical protein